MSNVTERCDERLSRKILVQFLFVSRFCVWLCRCLFRSRSVAWHWGNVDLNCFFKFKNSSCNSISFQKNVLRLGSDLMFLAFFSSLLFCIYFILFLQSSARSCRRKSRRRCTFTRWNRLWKYTKIVFQITLEKGVIYTQIIMFISQNVRLDMNRK